MKRYVIRDNRNKHYLINSSYGFNTSLDVNEARVFTSKRAASCAWTWATYGSESYLNSEIIEVEIKLK